MLVRNANQWYKMGSNLTFILIAVLSIVRQQWDEVFSLVMPNEWYPYLMAVLAVLGVFARLYDQGLDNEKPVQ